MNFRYSPDRYLALAAGAHQLVDGIPAEAYPINNWDELQSAADRLGDLSVRGPGGIRVAISEAIPGVADRTGSQYFPVLNADDLAHKAGMVIVNSILRRHAPSPASHAELSEDFVQQKARMSSRRK